MPHFSPIIQTLIERTGFTDDFLKDINKPYAAQLDGMEKFIDVLHSYRENNITISPDFDMDGITSGIILYAGLSQLGFRVNLHIPNYTYGHDFCKADVDDIISDHPETTVILTCDSAVNSIEGITYAQSLGLAVLVTDHHEQEVECPADAMIDPCQRNSSYPLPGICGAAVAFLTVSAYARKYGSAKQRRYLNSLQIFAGIGTISDVMPLVHDNRFLVRKSLQLSRELVSNPSALLTMKNDPDAHAALVHACEGYQQLLHELHISVDNVDEQFYGYTLSPMFNAPRRVGTDIADAFHVFVSSDAQKRKECIHRLIEANNQRKQAVAEYLETIDDTYAPYIYITDAPQGMLGLLAGHLMHQSSLPTAVVHIDADEKCIDGSMRSPNYYPLIDMLNNRDGLVTIGHQGACGVTGPLESLVDALHGVHVPHDYEPEPALIIGDNSSAEPVDVFWWDLPALSEVANFLEAVGPFGKDFEYPIIELRIPEGAQAIAIGSAKQHLKVNMAGCPPLLLWNAKDVPDSVRVRLGYNVFRGRKTLQMIGEN
ncbi:DHH family phosphoesterase [Alloscardovia theropitheci]|nr:DHH family phosphoesterase [Alloscardovia theropitheci]